MCRDDHYRNSTLCRTRTFKLFKAHGSTHWAREVEAPPIANIKDRNVWEVAHELIHNAPDLKLTDRYRIVTERPIGKLDTTPLFPAIAIPVETKRAFECPNEHLILEGRISCQGTPESGFRI